MTVLPYQHKNTSKKEQVAEMFDNISSEYDFLNHFLSVGIDKLWRKRAIKILQKDNPKLVLDIATGTADLAIQAMDLHPDKIIGVDISEGMLAKGREKIAKKGLSQTIELQNGDSERLLFADNTFDALMVAFGVRNFENLEKGLSDMYRVLKPNKTALILEFSKPKNFFFRKIYNFYFHWILPPFGRWFSKDARAYTYLPESVEAFPDGENFLEVLKKVGFIETQQIPLTFGIASLYIGKKQA
jgi:demethylmenaquinone methyltransferase / 2-methoxy-6-polyprenyl-1,4-benzoquinol methylase